MSAKEEEKWSFSLAKHMQAEERDNFRKYRRERILGPILSVREQMQGKEDRLIDSIPKDNETHDN